MSTAKFEPAVTAPARPAADAWIFVFRDRRLLTLDRPSAPSTVPRSVALTTLFDRLALVEQRRLFLGRLDGREIYACDVDAGKDLPPSTSPSNGDETPTFHSLRGVFGRLPDDVFWLAGRAVQLLEWDRDHQFCGRCATATEPRGDERSRVCPQCTTSHYPRLAPAVIVLVHDEDRLLLARSPHFPPGMYSTLAGFVEPGERLEETVSREIREEVGVAVREVRYFGSQPWPFPHSLMIGFTAAYAGGDLIFGSDADGEIEDAAWFPLHDLPMIPPRISIARALIDGYRQTRTS